MCGERFGETRADREHLPIGVPTWATRVEHTGRAERRNAAASGESQEIGPTTIGDRIAEGNSVGRSWGRKPLIHAKWFRADW